MLAVNGLFIRIGDYVKKNIYSLPINFSVENEVSDEDNRFIKVSIDVLHLGLNLNGSIFSKEVVEESLDTIKNTPILGFIHTTSNGEDDFKGHEFVLVRTENGIEEKYVGSAYGIIPESCNPRWITKICDDGYEREFLQVSGLIWTKFDDSANILLRDIEKPHSMELFPENSEGHEDEDGNFVFDKFSFNGCCILGEGVQPAMVDSCVTVENNNFSVNDFVKNLQYELNDKFEAFTKIMLQQNNQGGVKNMPNENFSQTLLSQFEDISCLVKNQETFKDRWGDDVPRFYLVDIQDEEVIVVDRSDNYRYYGFPFTMSGDKPEIDFACGGSRKKVRYENYEEGSEPPAPAFDFGKHIDEIENSAFEKISNIEGELDKTEKENDTLHSEFDAMKSQYEEIKPKYDAYVEAEKERQAKELSDQKDAKFAEYEDVLAENEAFEALKNKKDELSVDEIEKECAVLYVKSNGFKNSFSAASGKSAVVGVFEHGDDDSGYVHTKYGNIKIGQ